MKNTNENICMLRDRKTFHDRCLFEKGVTMVKHLMHEERNILSFVDFLRKFPSIGLDFLTYQGLISPTVVS